MSSISFFMTLNGEEKISVTISLLQGSFPTDGIDIFLNKMIAYIMDV